MPISALDYSGAPTWTPNTMSVWLALLQSELQRPAPDGLGPTSTVSDDSYVLCRLLIVLAAGLARWDIASGELLASVLDVNSAAGPALEVLGYRRGVKRTPGQRSIVKGTVTGTPSKQVGGVLVKDLAGIAWQLSPATVEASGFVSDVTVTAQVDGPVGVVLGPGVFTVNTQSPDVLAFEATSVVRIGQVVEPVELYRSRVIGARSVRGGVEFAIAKRLLEVSNVSRARAFVNRSASDKDGIPGHHVETIVTGGSDLDVAYALRDVAISATAGFAGNTLVVLPHPQGAEVGSTEVRFSRGITVRTFALLTVQISDAPVQLNATAQTSLARTLRGLVDLWAQTLSDGEVPLSSELEAYIKPRVSKGIISQMYALFGRSYGAWVNIIPLLRYETVRISSLPQPGQAVGSKTAPYAVANGYHLNVSYMGGAPQVITFLGAAPTLTDVLARINTVGLTNLVATESVFHTLQLATINKGSTIYFDILPASTGALLDTLGLLSGTYYGTDYDAGVVFT